MTAHDDTLQVTSVAAGLERSSDRPATPGPEQHKLDIFIGKWINAGRTVARPRVPSAEITSDIYEWAPGGFFMIHSAYGTIGGHGVGGVEIIDFDQDTRSYRSRFFDSQGNASESRLTEKDGTWTWSDQRTRCTATFSDDGATQTAHHEVTDDEWIPSMAVTLRKIA